MSDSKPRAFSKKYGTRKEVFDQVASMTRGGLRVEDLFIDDDGVIRSVKQQESLKKSEANLVKKEKKVAKKEEPKTESSDDSGGEGLALETSLKDFNICDIKDAVKKALENVNEKLPRGYSKWKKQQWIDEARRLEIVQ